MNMPSPNAPMLLQLAADYYNRYPGQSLRLWLRLLVPPQRGCTLQIALPPFFQVQDTLLPQGFPANLTSLIEKDGEPTLLLTLDEHFSAGAEYAIALDLRLPTAHSSSLRLDQRVLIEVTLLDADASLIDSAALRLTVFAKGAYLKYLPEIYAEDDFTGRFLMLFESFWKPVSQQIGQMDQYFDPSLTPPLFVPWLASWVGMSPDPSLPLDRVRALLKNARMFFQCRGTQQALKTYLEIYTSGRVSIVSRHAHNLVLGEKSLLGMEVALGKNNRPNTVSISLLLPKSELTRTGFTPDTYQRKIVEVVRDLVPAHAFYEVNCVFSDELI